MWLVKWMVGYDGWLSDGLAWAMWLVKWMVGDNLMEQTTKLFERSKVKFNFHQGRVYQESWAIRALGSLVKAQVFWKAIFQGLRSHFFKCIEIAHCCERVFLYVTMRSDCVVHHPFSVGPPPGHRFEAVALRPRVQGRGTVWAWGHAGRWGSGCWAFPYSQLARVVAFTDLTCPACYMLAYHAFQAFPPKRQHL